MPGLYSPKMYAKLMGANVGFEVQDHKTPESSQTEYFASKKAFLEAHIF